MGKSEVLHQIQEVGILPVLRASSVEYAEQLADAIAQGGITTLEVTMTVPDAIPLLKRLVQDRPELLIGAGTVLDAETARACIEAGAAFVVSPALNTATIELCQRYSVAVIPGALTPTEIMTAWKAGADVVKVFPVSAMGGPSYFKSLNGPFPGLKLIPTGGVTLNNAAEFLANGAIAVGVGTDLVNEAAIKNGEGDLVVRMAKSYTEAIANARR